MIRITIELLPGGREERKRTIGLMEVSNVGGTDTLGNYAVVLKKTPPFSGALRTAWRKGLLKCEDGRVSGFDGCMKGDEALAVGSFEGFHRKRLGVYDLAYLALKACGIDRRNT